MKIEIPTLILSVSCPAKVSVDDFTEKYTAEDLDTSTDNGIENFQVRASSIEQLTARSFRAINVEIETNLNDRDEKSMMIEAGEMIVKDYLEGTECDEYGDEVSLLTAFE